MERRLSEKANFKAFIFSALKWKLPYRGIYFRVVILGLYSMVDTISQSFPLEVWLTRTKRSRWRMGCVRNSQKSTRAYETISKAFSNSSEALSRTRKDPRGATGQMPRKRSAVSNGNGIKEQIALSRILHVCDDRCAVM